MLENKKMSIAAIVLAAGESRRMGWPKPLLTIRNKSFVRHIVDEIGISSVNEIVVVSGSDHDLIIEELEGSRADVVRNPNPAGGQLSSVLCGLSAVEQFSPDAFLLHPIDHPLIRSEIIDILISKFVEFKAPIVLPRYKGRRGHPVLFSAEVFGELKAASPAIGARAVVWKHDTSLLEIDVDFEGVVRNIDTQIDYEHLQKNI